MMGGGINSFRIALGNFYDVIRMIFRIFPLIARKTLQTGISRYIIPPTTLAVYGGIRVAGKPFLPQRTQRSQRKRRHCERSEAIQKAISRGGAEPRRKITVTLCGAKRSRGMTPFSDTRSLIPVI
jgi:hypothetical protein